MVVKIVIVTACPSFNCDAEEIRPYCGVGNGVLLTCGVGVGVGCGVGDCAGGVGVGGTLDGVGGTGVLDGGTIDGVGVGLIDVSFNRTVIKSPELSNVNVRVSLPSVVLSSVTVIVKLAVLLVIDKLPVRDTSISLLSTPVIVYGTLVPSLTLVVDNVIVALSPSSRSLSSVVRV